MNNKDNKYNLIKFVDGEFSLDVIILLDKDEILYFLTFERICAIINLKIGVPILYV